ELERGERAIEGPGGERLELEVQRDELDVRAGVVDRRQQEVFLAQHRADLVELGLADPVDPLADRRGRDRALREQLVERLVDAGVEDRAPGSRQLAAVTGRERRARSAEQ